MVTEYNVENTNEAKSVQTTQKWPESGSLTTTKPEKAVGARLFESKISKILHFDCWANKLDKFGKKDK